MGRRKVSMGLIPNRRARADTFGKRKKGLEKKAEELSVLCGVDVALVVAAGDGGAAAAADVWESREGVLARYRVLGSEARAALTGRTSTEDRQRALGAPPPADHVAEDGVIAPLRGGRKGGRRGRPRRRARRR